MKRIITFILVLCILAPSVAFAKGSDGPFYTERKNWKHEAWLWDELSMYSPNDYVTAAVLSYFWRESQYRSDAVAGYASSLTGYGIDLCKTITEKTDEGLEDGSSRKYFLKKARWHGGYGLGQWYSMHYLEDLYDFARETGATSIGDASMQCEFIFYSLQKDEWLWKRLKNVEDASTAGYYIGKLYDGSGSAAEYMKYKAVKLYNKYHEES